MLKQIYLMELYIKTNCRWIIPDKAVVVASTLPTTARYNLPTGKLPIIGWNPKTEIPRIRVISKLIQNHKYQPKPKKSNIKITKFIKANKTNIEIRNIKKIIRTFLSSFTV